jgi:glycyl-tRNA synthetase
MTEQDIKKLKISLIENQYIIPAFEIYGNSEGFHDYGILGTKVKNKLVDFWREFFLFPNDIDEIESPIIIPYDVLKSSGHVDKFRDLIVFDSDNVCYRADHLLENYFDEFGMNDKINEIASWTANRMSREINKYKIIDGPISKEDPNVRLGVDVKTTSLMYEVKTTNNNNEHGIDFLRPELAQNIFLNFKRVYEFNNRELPFGIAQTGKSYRKEISPTPFIRMREFNQAEIEFFFDPKNTKYSRVKEYIDRELPLLSSKNQKNNEDIQNISLKKALQMKIINHEITAYFIARMHDFCLLIGIDRSKLRFRQHMPGEMAHYANHCWDLECFVNNKWLECAGIADRGSYDLENHSKNSGIELVAKRTLENPNVTNVLKAKLNHKLIAQKYVQLIPKITSYYENLSQDKLKELKDEVFANKDSMYIYIDDMMCIITRDMINIIEDKITDTNETFYPNVLEPSIGIDRLLYTVFEHNFIERDGRIVLSLPDILVPYDVAIFSLHKKDEQISVVNDLKYMLKDSGKNIYSDTSNTSIDKRYIRSDEIGIKYVITVDSDSLIDNQITIRERDTMKQIRKPIKELVRLFVSPEVLFI